MDNVLNTYRVTYEGKTWTTEDLTLDETVECETEVGESWLALNPLRSAKWVRAILVRFLMRDHPEPEARKLIGSITVQQALKSITPAEDDRPAEYEGGTPVVDPKAGEGAPVTT